MHEEKDVLSKEIVGQSARAILIDGQDNLILFKRNKPGAPVYWVTPGGRVEQTDNSVETTLKRELLEELNARVTNISRVFIYSSVSTTGLIIEHFFVARLASINESAPRSGLEFQNPNIHGTYEMERIKLLQVDWTPLNLKPEALKGFIMANEYALITMAGGGIPSRNPRS